MESGIAQIIFIVLLAPVIAIGAIPVISFIVEYYENKKRLRYNNTHVPSRKFYFDKDGTPIEYPVWINKYTDGSYRLLKGTVFADRQSVFTLWEGISEEPTQCLSLFVTTTPWGSTAWKSEEEAIKGHESIMSRIETKYARNKISFR